MPPFQVAHTIAKIDVEQRNVFGWAQVSQRAGDAEPFFDSQGDRVHWTELEKAGYDFTLHSGPAGEMHVRKGVGSLIESMVFTPEKVEKMGLDPATVPLGWWVGFHVDDDAVWAKVRSGQYSAFSVGGQGVRTPVVSKSTTDPDDDPDDDDELPKKKKKARSGSNVPSTWVDSPIGAPGVN